MPGEFNDLIPLPRRNPTQRIEPTPFEQILAGPQEEDQFFDADDVSFAARMPVPASKIERAVQTPLPVILDEPAVDDDRAHNDPDGLRGFIGLPASNRQPLRDEPVLLERELLERQGPALQPRRQSGTVSLTVPSETVLNANQLLSDGSGALPLRDVGFSEALGIAGAQLLTRNSSDEFEAHMRALVAKARGDRRPISEIFQEELHPIQRLISEAERQQPLATAIIKILGITAGPKSLIETPEVNLEKPTR